MSTPYWWPHSHRPSALRTHCNICGERLPLNPKRFEHPGTPLTLRLFWAVHYVAILNNPTWLEDHSWLT